MRLTEVATPCLLLDEARMDRNITRLRDRLAAAKVGFRPHLKTAKSVEVARRLMTTPEGPATVSTLKEAEAFAQAGVRDLTYAVGLAPDKLERIKALRQRGVVLTVILDSVEQARAVAGAFDPADPLRVLIEIDCDGHRSGVPPQEEARLIEIARALGGGGALRGVLTHAGESYNARGIPALQAAAEQERLAVVSAARTLRDAGFACPLVSVGSTPTAFFASHFDGVTEVRAGVFVLFDLVQAGIGVCTIGEIASTVLTTVIGHQKSRGWTIVDAGWMALSRDRGTAKQALDQGYGLVCDLAGHPLEMIVVDANQEHGIVAMRPGAAEPWPDLPIGTRLRILPNHACATGAQHERYHVIGAGGDEITDLWPRFSGW